MIIPSCSKYSVNRLSIQKTIRTLNMLRASDDLSAEEIVKLESACLRAADVLKAARILRDIHEL